MLTFFVRHTGDLGVDDDMLEGIWNERKIGIHFPWDIRNRDRQGPDSTSIDPNDYDGANRAAMRTLVELARDGGYVCARYRGHESLLIGKVAPNSEIELLYGLWGEMYRELRGRVAIMKTLQLNDAREVTEIDHLSILVGQPQRGTICRWRRVGELIRALVEGERVQASLGSLLTAQQETMCSEFLRSAHGGLPKLVHLLLPVGRTMKDVDIYGFATDGRRIFGQVTYSEFDRASNKFQRLRVHATKAHVVFFCKHKRQELIDGVTVVPVEELFREFTKTEAGKQWLEFALS